MVRKSLSAPRRVALGILASVAVFGLAVSAQQTTDPQAAVNAAFKQFQNLKEGKNADYIPALAKVDPNLFGIALVTVDGKVFTAGDVTTEVSIQSISKVFTMATGHPGAGARIHRETDRRRCNGREIQLHHRDRRRALGRGNRRAGDERARESRRDLVHQHGARFEC